MTSTTASERVIFGIMNANTGCPLWRMMCTSPRQMQARAPSSSIPARCRFRNGMPTERETHGALGSGRIAVDAVSEFMPAFHVIGGQLGGGVAMNGWSADDRCGADGHQHACGQASGTGRTPALTSGAAGCATEARWRGAPRIVRARVVQSDGDSVRFVTNSSRTACSAATREWHGQTRTCSSTPALIAPRSPSIRRDVGSIDRQSDVRTLGVESDQQQAAARGMRDMTVPTDRQHRRCIGKLFPSRNRPPGGREAPDRGLQVRRQRRAAAAFPESAIPPATRRRRPPARSHLAVAVTVSQARSGQFQAVL